MEQSSTDADIGFEVSRNLEKAKERLAHDVAEGRILKDSKAIILRFIRDLDISKISKHRQYFYLERLRVVAKVLQKKFTAPSSDDIKDAL